MSADVIEMPVEVLQKLTDKLSKMDKKIEELEKHNGLDKESKKQRQIQAKKEQRYYEEWKLKVAKKLEESNGLDPLTTCGVINSAIGYADPDIAQLPYANVDDNPNFATAFPYRFGMSLRETNALIVKLIQMNDSLYTASLASKWYTTGQIPQWSQTVLDRNGGYNIGATVQLHGVFYTSLVNNNMAQPVNNSLLDYVNWKIADIQFPVGRTVFSPNANADDGFLIANGATLSKAQYWNLWKYAIHNGIVVAPDVWNAGAIGCFADLGGDNFKIPDLRGRYLRGANSGTTNDSRRNSTEVGTYKAGDILQHNHDASSPEHNHDASQDRHTHALQVPYKVPFVAQDVPNPGGIPVPQFASEPTVNNVVDAQPAVHIGNRSVTVNVGNRGTDQNSVNDIAYTIQIKY